MRDIGIDVPTPPPSPRRPIIREPVRLTEIPLSDTPLAPPQPTEEAEEAIEVLEETQVDEEEEVDQEEAEDSSTTERRGIGKSTHLKKLP